MNRENKEYKVTEAAIPLVTSVNGIVQDFWRSPSLTWAYNIGLRTGLSEFSGVDTSFVNFEKLLRCVFGRYSIRSAEFDTIPRNQVGSGIEPYSFRIDRIPLELKHSSYLPHVINMLTLFDDLSLSFDGKRVIDFGAGIGTLGFMALLKGAEHAFLVDNDQKSSQAARRIIELNKVDPSLVTIMETGIEAPNWKPPHAEIAIANIGSSNQPIYGDADQRVFQRVSQMTELRQVLLGGYIRDERFDGGDSIINMYRELGFDIVSTARTAHPQCTIPEYGYFGYYLER